MKHDKQTTSVGYKIGIFLFNTALWVVTNIVNVFTLKFGWDNFVRVAFPQLPELTPWLIFGLVVFGAWFFRKAINDEVRSLVYKLLDKPEPDFSEQLVGQLFASIWIWVLMWIVTLFM